jgi:hypothetical protein
MQRRDDGIIAIMRERAAKAKGITDRKAKQAALDEWVADARRQALERSTK